MGARIGDDIAATRSARFVGRRAERELFSAALDGDAPSWSVLWLHGPGGIGKTSLIEVLARTARDAGAAVVDIDGRALAAGATPPLDALTALVDRAVADEVDDNNRCVLILDGFDSIADLEEPLRRDLLPRLPASALVVIAGRTGPSTEWRIDPGWRERLRIVSLRNLSPDDAGAYLQRCGIEPVHRASLIEASHGHPFALSLMTDLAHRDGSNDGGGVEAVLDDPDLVTMLLRRILDGVPSPTHREAIEVCAIARVTTEDLLREALGIEDATTMFDWLRRQSFVESGKDGVWPHDLARDVIDLDLRWRDPAAYRAVFRRVRAHIHRRLETLRGAEQRRAIADEKFVFRNLPSVLSPVDWSSWGGVDPRPAQADDRDEILGLVSEHEGAESAQIAARWWRCQPEAFFVVPERDGTVRGFITLLTLGSPDDAAFDPGVCAAWEHTDREAPVRTGEQVTVTRFVIDRDRYQGPSPTLNCVPILTLQRYLQMPELAWDFLCLFEPDPLNDYFAIADLPRAVEADFEVGGRRYGLFAHDFRRVPVDAWLEGVTERALAQDPARPAATVELLVLSHEDFTGAVRQALRDLNQREKLARNALTRARIVVERCDSATPSEVVLRSLLADTIANLGDHASDRKRATALEHTYVRPAPSQEAAAEILGLAFSTYRRHLTEGIEHVVAVLWELELRGSATVGRG